MTALLIVGGALVALAFQVVFLCWGGSIVGLAAKERRLAKAHADEAATCERLAREALDQAAALNKAAWRAIEEASDQLHAQVLEWTAAPPSVEALGALDDLKSQGPS